MDRTEKIGTLTSLKIGIPVGFLAVAFGFLAPAMITGEVLFTVGFVIFNGYSTVGLLISFVIILGIAGKIMGREIKNQKSSLRIRIKYSAIVNGTIWTTFILIHSLTNESLDPIFGLILPIGLGLISVILTPATIGLLIYRISKKRIIKIASAHQ